jgi:hypothetical protein
VLDKNGFSEEDRKALEELYKDPESVQPDVQPTLSTKLTSWFAQKAQSVIQGQQLIKQKFQDISLDDLDKKI